MDTIAHRYEEGDIVYDVLRPQQLMIITKCKGFVYYCRLIENKKDHPIAFMHRDLRQDMSFASRNQTILRKDIGQIF